jgi:pyruvate,water dikinase
MTFHPGSCRTLHDVVRYVHEMSVRAMFETGDSLAKSRSYRTVRLDAGLGVRVLIIDLGGGLDDLGESDFIKPGQVRSRPFTAIYRGMTRPGVRWTGPPPISARGFASVLVTAAADPGMGSRLLGGDSYLLVSEDYMNLSARLAYHFAMVDANLAGRDRGNYINFRFKGGGANLERRTRRARFLEGVLSLAGFTVTLEQDLVNAWIKERTAAETEAALATVGALLGSARQLDMAMENDSTMEWFKQQFMAGNYAFNQNSERRGTSAANIRVRDRAFPREVRGAR